MERPQAAETGEMYNFRKSMMAPAIMKSQLESDLTTRSIDYRTASNRYQKDESMFASRSSSLGTKSTSRKNISCEILRRKQLG
jgi:hypothetical protein